MADVGLGQCGSTLADYIITGCVGILYVDLAGKNVAVVFATLCDILLVILFRRPKGACRPYFFHHWVCIALLRFKCHLGHGAAGDVGSACIRSQSPRRGRSRPRSDGARAASIRRTIRYAARAPGWSARHACAMPPPRPTPPGR